MLSNGEEKDTEITFVSIWVFALGYKLLECRTASVPTWLSLYNTELCKQVRWDVILVMRTMKKQERRL